MIKKIVNSQLFTHLLFIIVILLTAKLGFMVAGLFGFLFGEVLGILIAYLLSDLSEKFELL